MKKTFSTVCIVIVMSILLLALTSCGLELSNPLLRRVTRYNDAEKELAEKACTAIQNQDAEALRELFSEGAIKRVPNLSNDIDKLLSLFGTDIVSFDTGLPFDSGSIEGGERVTDATCLATITTSDKEYTLNLSMRVEDTVHPEEIGLNYILVYMPEQRPYVILLNNVSHMQKTIDDIYLVLLLLTVLFFVVCILFVHMTRLYNEKTEYMLKNQELEYVEKNQSLVHYLHDNILKIQHSLRYGLILIENNIDDKKYGDAKHQIEQFYDLLDNKTNIMTNNYIFDTLLNDYIFLIKSKYNSKVKSLINIGNDSFFKDVNNCTKIITIISNFFEQSDKTYLEIKLIEYETYVELDLLVESNFEKINDDTNIDYFDNYAHLRRIFDK